MLLDGEGIVYNGKGMPDFRLLHGKQNDVAATLVAFDLLELDGEDRRAARRCWIARSAWCGC